MGFRTHRYEPTSTSRRGASHIHGVPRPTAAKTHWQDRYRAMPIAMTATAGQAKGVGNAERCPRISQGPYRPPRPGTMTVKRQFRSARLTTLIVATGLLTGPSVDVTCLLIYSCSFLLYRYG